MQKRFRVVIFLGVGIAAVAGASLALRNHRHKPSETSLVVEQDVLGVPVDGFESSSTNPNNLQPIASVEAINLEIPPAINRKLVEQCGDPVPEGIRVQALVTKKETILFDPPSITSSIHGPLVNYDKGFEVRASKLLDERSPNLRHISGSLNVRINGHDTRVDFDATIHVDSEDPIHVKDAQIHWIGPFPMTPAK
ncbi:MAG: hypothetical protein ACTHN5_07315 [Phycisphaerae bacterium]